MLCYTLPKILQHLGGILETVKSDALITGTQLRKFVFLHEEVKIVSNVKRVNT